MQFLSAYYFLYNTRSIFKLKLGNENIIENAFLNTDNKSHEIIDKDYNFKQKISYLRSRQSLEILKEI